MMVNVVGNFTFFSGRKDIYSHWHPSRFMMDDVEFDCGEQGMMWLKATLFGDHDAARRILETHDPREQKAIGREVQDFIESIWLAAARPLVYRVNVCKFSQNPPMLMELLSTRGTILVEASSWDSLWGIGLDATDPRAHDQSTWKGSNWLGFTLTSVRDDCFRVRSAA